MTSQHHRIVIVGSGFSGIGMAVRLLEDGERDFVLLERAGELGGTWRDNTYPPAVAATCPRTSTRSRSRRTPNWSSTSRRSPRYSSTCATWRGASGSCPTCASSTSCAAPTGTRRLYHWRLDTSQGELTADVLVAYQGPLSEPRLPDVPGIESFEGTMFHWSTGTTSTT